jgi:hypothetical protein
LISITCTNCQSVLTIDDAFAGGVCRCQFCGTIQTVPSKKKSMAHLAGATTAKTLYQHDAPAAAQPMDTDPSGTGMEDLAHIVASSGLAGSGLAGSGMANVVADAAPTAPPPVAVEIAPPQPQKLRSPIVLITAASVVLVVVVVTIVALRFRGARAGATRNAITTPVATGPSFCGIPISGNSVIFVLDRGNSMSEFFDALKGACYKSLKQLGPDRKFQVILWDNDAGGAEFPAGAMRNATAGAVEDCQRNFQDISASGSSHLSGALREAIERRSQTIVIATAKMQFDEDDAAALRNALGTGIHVNVLQIAVPSPAPQLEEVSRSTGGQFKIISPDELKAFAR